MKGLPSGSCSSAHLAQLAVIILSAMHEAECLRIPNAAAVRSKKEGIYERQRFPSWGRACLAGPHISYTNASQICPPLLNFFLKYQLQILKGSFWGGICLENVSRCFTHPCTICVPSSRSSFLDDCRKSRGDHVVGLVTCSSAPISKQRVSQRTNNNICSHRATEWEKNKNKQEEKRENRSRS